MAKSHQCQESQELTELTGYYQHLVKIISKIARSLHWHIGKNAT